MNKQLFLNNFTTVFAASVKNAPVTGTPATELDYGILRLSSGAAGVLLNPTGGDYYIVTAFKKSGSTESAVEIMKVTAVDNATVGECRITVLRAQEGTTLQGYVAGDYLSVRFTRDSAANLVQTADMTAALASKANLNSPTFTGTVSGITAAMVGAQVAGTNSNLTGDVTSVGNATTLTNAPVIAKVLTGFVSGAGTVAATDSILQAINKLSGNDALKAPTANPVFTGNVTGLGASTGTSFNSITALSSTLPVVAGAAAIGVGTTTARGDHVHPVQTTVSGNAGTVTNATLTTALIVNTGTVTVAGNVANTSVLTLGAGASSVSGANTGDNAANTTYASDYRAANFVAGTNYLAPTGSAASLTGFPTLNQNTSGTAAGLSAVLAPASGGTGIANNAAMTVTGAGNFAYTRTLTGITNVTFPISGTLATTAQITGTNSGTNTGDNSINTLYSGLVTNATHTGDATGSAALTVVKINGTLMSGLATGILKNTTGTGVPSIATAGTDYVTPTGTETLSGKTLTGITETVYALSGTTPAFSEANGSIQTWTLSAASTPTDSLTTGQSLILVITPGAYSITWPGGLLWTKVGGSGAAPTLYSAGKTTVILWKIGSTLYASHLGDM